MSIQIEKYEIEKYEIEEYLKKTGISQNELGRVTGVGQRNMSARKADGCFVVVHTDGSPGIYPESCRRMFE